MGHKFMKCRNPNQRWTWGGATEAKTESHVVAHRGLDRGNGRLLL